MPASEQRAHGLELHAAAHAIDQALKQLVHLCAVPEQQVAAVFALVHRVAVAEVGSLLIGDVHGEAQHGGVDPTLADLKQPPYRALRAQGLCDLLQACGVGPSGEAVVLLPKSNPAPVRLGRHPFVAVEDDQRSEGRMRAKRMMTWPQSRSRM